MATSKMRKIFRNYFRILDVVIFALSHFAHSHFRPLLKSVPGWVLKLDIAELSTDQFETVVQNDAKFAK